MHTVDIDAIDLNLLRLFDAIYSARNVSRAAAKLKLSQPAASQALTRLRLLLGDPLFERSSQGVRPTPRADHLAGAVRSALATLAQALGEGEAFEPVTSQRTFRCHLSDIGEARFLPALMAALHKRAPQVRLECHVMPHANIAAELDAGRLDFAIGFLPSVSDTQRKPLLRDRYVVLLREGHPLAARPAKRGRRGGLSDLAQLEYVAVRSHSETLRILHLLRLEHRVRLTASHFLALPAIVRATELGVVMPEEIARGFAAAGGYTLIAPPLPLRDFTVSLHWSRRFEEQPAQCWMRALVTELFAATN
jgi:DNA-binding transcriptional LysR family regulator